MCLPMPVAQQAGGVLALFATLWYLGLQARWFRLWLAIGWGQATMTAVANFALALLAITGAAMVLAMQ
jgi:hypothetical protein